MNENLQFEITAYENSKMLGVLFYLQRSCPLRAQHVKWSASNISCPFKNSINGGNCNYVHINIKARKIKKFSQLMDFVCGRDRLHQNLSNVVSSNVPMTMKARKKVLSALYRISGVLPRYPILSADFCSSTAHKMEVQRFTKVPILASEANSGIESDITMGDGRNGTDTSGYASTMNS